MATKARKKNSPNALCLVTESAINEQLNRCDLLIDAGVQTAYAEGVAAALRWVTGDLDEAPFPEAVESDEDF